MTITIRLFVFLTILMLCQLSYSDGFTDDFEIFKGDANGDGLIDLYIKPKPKIVLIHGEIVTPIVLPPSVKEFVLIQNSLQDFIVEDSTSFSSNYSQWQLAAGIVSVIKDINLDGTDDLIIKNLVNEIPLANDIIIYSDHQINTLPTGARQIDQYFKQFVQEVSAWIKTPTYFEDNAPVVPISIPIDDTIWLAEYCANYAWVELYGPLSNLPPIPTIVDDTLSDIYQGEQIFLANCLAQGLNIVHYDFVSVRYFETEYVKDYSVFNQDALQFSLSFGGVFDDKSLDPDNSLSDDLSTWLEIILGAEFRPWIYYGSDDDSEFGLNINPYLNARMIFTQLDTAIADEEDREAIEEAQRQKAEDNINQAKDMIFGDLRDGDLTLIGLEEGEVKDDFDPGIKITLVEKCGKTAAACGKYKEWFGGTGEGTGVRDVVLEIVISAVQDIGDAIEVLAHELRHLTLYNRELGTPDPDEGDYYNHPAEVDARVEGRKVREHYGY